MSLPSSFPISASQINVELGRSAGTAFDIQGTTERELAGVPAGALSFSDFLGKAILTKTASTADGGGSSPHTFTAASIGPAFSDRWVVVASALHKGATGALNITAVTIGGVAASGTDSGTFGASGPSMGAGLFYANLPSGTTADIVITWTGGLTDGAAIIVMTTPRLTLFNDYRPTPSAGWSSLTGPVNVPSNGVVVASASHTTGTAAWSGLTAQATQALTGGTLAVAFDVHQGSQTARSIQTSWGSGGNGGFEIVAFSQA